MRTADAKKSVLELISARSGEFHAVSQSLHENPETALQEHAASRLLCDFLENEGFGVERGVAGMETAFRATWGDAGPGIAILAEMDALPDIGHACGHNIIAGAAMGAAAALRHALPSGSARIFVFGTPAEEQGIGKIEFIRHGLFDGVDFAMMVHPSSRRYVMKHYLGLARVRFVFSGRGAHAAAYPEDGVNALEAAVLMFNSVNALRQHLRQDVRVHGIIADGGVTPSMIPARSECYFYLRAEDLEMLALVKERVQACAAGAASATGCSVETIEDSRVLEPFRINLPFIDLYRRQLEFLELVESPVDPFRNRGSSDIGNVSRVVPTVHAHVPIGEGMRIHTSGFAQATVSEGGRAAVLEGARAMALAGVELALDPAVRKEIISFQA